MQNKPAGLGALEGIDDVPWADLDACHDASVIPALFREVAAGTRRSLVAADQLLQTVWHQYSLFEASVPACRYVGKLAASDLRVDLRCKLISYLLLLGEGTTFVEPSGGARHLEPSEFAEQLERETRIVEQVRVLVREATDRLLGQLVTAPAGVQQAMLGLARLGTQPLPAEVLENLREIAEAVPPKKRSAAQLAIDHLERRPLRIDLLEQEWQDVSDGDELLQRARQGEFSERDWETLLSETAGRLFATPLDRDGLWARAHLFDDNRLLSVDEVDGPLPVGKHCIRPNGDGRWQVFYSDGRQASFVVTHDSEEAACEHVSIRVRNSPARWDAEDFEEFQNTLDPQTKEGRSPAALSERRKSALSAQRLVALRGLRMLTTLRQLHASGQQGVDIGAVSGYLHHAISGGSSDPDGFMPLLEYWMVAVSADATCDEELRLATQLALDALTPTLSPDRTRYSPDPAKAPTRRSRAEVKMREWLVKRGVLSADE